MANLDFENFIHNSISETLRSILFQKYIKKKQVDEKSYLRMKDYIYMKIISVLINHTSYILHHTRGKKILLVNIGLMAVLITT